MSSTMLVLSSFRYALITGVNILLHLVYLLNLCKLFSTTTYMALDRMSL